MWKLLAVPFVAVAIALGSSQAMASPALNAGIKQDAVPRVTLAKHNHNYKWKRFPRYSGGYNHYRYRGYNRYHYHSNRYYYPYYRRAYRPYFGWNYCGWGYGYPGYGCFGPGYYGGYWGGYYGNWYPERRYDYSRHERVSNKKHVRWCKNRYKTYNSKTDTFIGKGRKKYRCNSPYDGRR